MKPIQQGLYVLNTYHAQGKLKFDTFIHIVCILKWLAMQKRRQIYTSKNLRLKFSHDAHVLNQNSELLNWKYNN